MPDFKVMQINMGKRNTAGKIEKLIEDHKLDIMLIQEPCAAQIPGGTTIAVAPRTSPIRAKIWLSHSSFKKLKPILLEQLSDSDTFFVAIHTSVQHTQNRCSGFHLHAKQRANHRPSHRRTRRNVHQQPRWSSRPISTAGMIVGAQNSLQEETFFTSSSQKWTFTS